MSVREKVFTLREAKGVKEHLQNVALVFCEVILGKDKELSWAIDGNDEKEKDLNCCNFSSYVLLSNLLHTA